VALITWRPFKGCDGRRFECAGRFALDQSTGMAKISLSIKLPILRE
jgi:hypothetical protein